MVPYSHFTGIIIIIFINSDVRSTALPNWLPILDNQDLTSHESNKFIPALH